MKLLLSSADRMQIERFARILFVAGVPSEIRDSRVEQDSTHPTGTVRKLGLPKLSSLGFIDVADDGEGEKEESE